MKRNHVTQHHGVLWVTGAALAVGNATGGWLGAHTSVRRGEILIRRVLYATLTVFIIRFQLFWPSHRPS